jgi:hypothetical protein
MHTNTRHTTLSTLLKRTALCGLAALILSASGLPQAAAIPPEPLDPVPSEPTVYKPDLVISSVQESAAYWVLVTIKNQGNASSNSCTFRLSEWYLDPYLWESFLMVTKNYYVPPMVKGGTYSFWVNTTYAVYNNPYFSFNGMVDVNKVVSESNESNNEKWFYGS